ncbi:MAG: thioredoxin family protein [Verrucomicrobiaceae bacterium]|nr:thioredoxin family protein [Verrucomicrobiaceae bacterium]
MYFRALLFTLALGSSFVLAQSSKPLTAELLAELTGIVPGKSLTLGIKLTHEEGSHSYWVNPGGPGKPTALNWKLPDGFKASEPQWPTPHAMEFFDSINYGFEKEAVVLVKVETPSTLPVGSSVDLAVIVNALVCKDNCQPVKAEASLRLPVVEAEIIQESTQDLFKQARANLPVGLSNWTVAASQENGKAVLQLTPGEGANPEPGKIYFFSRTLEIDTQKAQTAVKSGGVFRLELGTVEDSKLGEGLDGVITAESGWLKNKPEVKAFDLKLKFGGSVGSAAAEPTSATPAANVSPTTTGQGTLSLLLFAFLGGLILNIMPCVFPVIGIKILGFVQQAGENKKAVILHGLAYTLGVLVCFWVLALLVKLLGLSWGGQLQNAAFVLGLCYFFVIFGLNMAGVFEIGASAVGLANAVQHKSGLGRSFFDGLLATVVATPCSAPFLGPALAWAISLSTVQALLVFSVIGLGLSAPYLVMSAFPQLVKYLPRPGSWMESFKQGMSFLLIATSGWLLWTLAGLVDEQKHLLMTFGAVMVAFGCWVYGRWCLPYKSKQARTIGGITAIAAIAGALMIGWPQKKTASKLEWAAWSPALMADLADQGELVYVDFTARWCATCQVNKHVYSDPQVIAAFKKHDVKLVKADWTDENPEIKAVLKSFNQEAVPVNILYGPDGPIIVNTDNLFASEILDALSKL